MKRVKFSLKPEQWAKWFNKIEWKSPKVLGGALAVVLVLGGSYLYSANTTTVVLINGEAVGIVESAQIGKDLVEKVLNEKGASLGVAAKTHDTIEYKNQLASGEADELTKEEIEQKLSYYIEGVELTVADNPIVILPDQEDADNLLKAYQELYTQPSEANQVASVSFEEEVETQVVEASLENVLTFDQALEKLKTGNVERSEYEIQPDDSWWLIARKNNLLTSEVLAANPGTTVDSVIKPGEKIFLEKVSPYITVVSEGTQIDKEVIPFDVVTKTDATLASGQSKVTQSGADGEKEVKYSYVKKNDKVVTKEILDEKILKESVAQVITKGAKQTQVAVAYSRGSGQTGSGFSRPYGGGISSYYGYRGGEFHTGVDYSGHTGDPFIAAASGRVVSAGWNGGYGLSLIIDHGNGIQTRYAHASKLLVSVGQSVSRGQTIGLVGSTGRSTGPHLHFEIIINGDTVNPLNYVR